MNKTVLATALALGMGIGAAQAAPVAFNAPGNFTMYDPTGAIVGVYNDITGFIDTTANTFSVASTSPFFGLTWTASGGTVFGPGSYTISTVDPAPGVSGGSYTVNVGAGQMGGHIDFAWGGTTGIDVLMVWNVTNVGGNTIYTSVDTDADADAIPGTKMIDGPFPGFSANFSFQTPVPVPAAVWLFGAGLLGLVGVARRKKA